MADDFEDREPTDAMDADAAYSEEPALDAEDQEKADYAFARWACQRDAYTPLFKLWTRAILFLLGKQWLDWDEKSRRWVPEQNVPKWRQRPMTNLVFAVYRTAIAKLTKQKPVFDVVPPRNGDADDRESSHIGESLLQQLWRSLRTSRLLGKAVGWLLSTGNVYLEVFWEPEGGNLVPLTVPVMVPHPLTGEMEEVECACDEEGEPVTTELGEPDLDAEPMRVFEGEVAHRLVSPLHVRFNPEATSKEDATEWYVGELWPVARAMREFNLTRDAISGTDDDDLEEFEDLIASSAGADAILGVTGTGADRDQMVGERCLVLKYYRKPDTEYPDGRHWVQVNRTPVRGDDEEFEQPLPEGFWPPLVALEDVPVPGQTQAMGLLGQVCPLNREYNGLNGKIAEHNVTMAMGGKWITAPVDRALKITTDPGQKLVSEGYLMGLPPIQAQLHALPSPVYQERERILNDVMLVSGMNELSMGKRPEGVSAGRAFLVMQEAVDSVLTPTLMNIEEAFQEIGRRMLVLAQRYYREERTVKIRGQNGRWEVRSFLGADLGDSIDVQVQIGSSFPWSKSARQDLALNVVQAMPGLVTDATGQVDGAKLAKILEIGGIRAFEIEGDPDLIEVQMEHAMFEAYNPERGVTDLPELGFWQAHPKHYTAHAELLKRDRPRFGRWHPAAQQAFLRHLLMTQAAIKQTIESMTGGGVEGQPPGAPAAPPAGGPGGAPGDPAAGAPTQDTLQLQDADFAAAGQ